jgi:hypothetical protein
MVFVRVNNCHRLERAFRLHGRRTNTDLCEREQRSVKQADAMT